MSQYVVSAKQINPLDLKKKCINHKFVNANENYLPCFKTGQMLKNSFAVVKYRDIEKSSWPNTGFSLEKLFKVCNFSKYVVTLLFC